MCSGIQKTLEDANLKIASGISDVVGQRGRAILNAIIEHETDPAKLVALARRRLRASRASLGESLRGRITPHPRFMLKLHLAQVEVLERALESIEAEVGATLEPFRAKADLFDHDPRRQ